jgi:hypothetical protein
MLLALIMAVYSIVSPAFTLSLTADVLTLQAPANGQCRILELIYGTESTTGNVVRFAVQRAGTSITGNTVITPEKFNSRSPAAAGTYGKGGTQALVGNPLLALAYCALGTFVRWLPGPGEEIWYVNSEVISIRSLVGTTLITLTAIFEEL